MEKSEQSWDAFLASAQHCECCNITVRGCRSLLATIGMADPTPKTLILENTNPYDEPSAFNQHLFNEIERQPKAKTFKKIYVDFGGEPSTMLSILVFANTGA